MDILLTVVEYQVVGPLETLGKTGHCSAYLANLEIGSDVSMYFQTSRDMHLPEPLAGIDGFSIIDQRPLILGKIDRQYATTFSSEHLESYMYARL